MPGTYQSSVAVPGSTPNARYVPVLSREAVACCPPNVVRNRDSRSRVPTSAVYLVVLRQQQSCSAEGQR